MNKNKYLIITLITFGLLFTISGSVAYFNYVFEGSIKANTANYTLNITSESISNQSINLGNNLKPYDKGSFTINLNLDGTNADVLTTVSIERVNLPKGFRFLAQDDNMSPFSTYSKIFEASSSTKTDSVTVYWYWDGHVDSEDDTSFINQTLSANIVVKSKQMNGAMMKNGNSDSSSSRTEFWSDTYRPYIRTIKFDNDLSNLPSSCTGDSDLCWDISYDGSQNKKVYAYLIDVGLDYIDSDSVSHDLYNLYITSMASIFAPIDSSYMFKDFTNLISIDFNNNFDTSKVTNIAYMFENCSSLISLDLSSFNTSNVTAMNHMFNACSSLSTLDISSFNTSNVTTFRYMFFNCKSLVNLDLSSFNSSNVTNMEFTFYGCRSLVYLDLSGFNTSNLQYMNGTFWICSTLTTTINIIGTGITGYNHIFSGAAQTNDAVITLNYTAETSDLVDSMIASKPVVSNVVKGRLIV